MLFFTSLMRTLVCAFVLSIFLGTAAAAQADTDLSSTVTLDRWCHPLALGGQECTDDPGSTLDEIRPMDTLTFTVHVIQTGDPAANAQFVWNYGTQYQFVSSIVGPGTDDPINNTLTFDIGNNGTTLDAGSQNFDIVATVLDGTLTNQLVFSGSTLTTTNDTDPNNDAASWDSTGIFFAQSELSIQDETETDTPWFTGLSVFLNYKIYNNGLDRASNATFHITLPDNMSFDMNWAIGSCTYQAHEADCVIDQSIEPDFFDVDQLTSYDITIVAIVDSPQNMSQDVIASVSADQDDLAAGNNEVTTSNITMNYETDVSISRTSWDAVAEVGTPHITVFTVDNGGIISSDNLIFSFEYNQDITSPVVVWGGVTMDIVPWNVLNPNECNLDTTQPNWILNCNVSAVAANSSKELSVSVLPEHEIPVGEWDPLDTSTGLQTIVNVSSASVGDPDLVDNTLTYAVNVLSGIEPAVDLCPNIVGDQATMPVGAVYALNGNCVSATSGNDIFVLANTGIIFNSLGGNDHITGGTGNDTLTGGTGSDTLLGLLGADILNGGTGADILKGGAGIDRLTGGHGNDKLIGGTGKDKFFGGGGNDRLLAKDGRGGDVVDCGAGYDRYSADRRDTVKGNCEKRI